MAHHDQERWKELEELDVKVMEARLRVLGEEHLDMPTVMASLAYTLIDLGPYDVALELMKRSATSSVERR